MTQESEDPEAKSKIPLKYILIAALAAIIAVAITLWILSIMIIGHAPGSCCLPVGSWMEPEIKSPTEVDVPFGHMTPEPPLTDLMIILVMNDSHEGRYTFQSNYSQELIRESGDDVGVLYYSDLTDNEKVNIGDEIQMVDLLPDSEYTIKLYYAPTGDWMATENFRTPPG